MRGLLVLVPVVVFAAACGERGSSPAGPSAPPSTSETATAPATALTVTGPEAVPTGSVVQYKATATLSNGATIYNALATWSTDDGAVAIIDSYGVLTANRQGTVTITATYRGKSTTTACR